MTFRTTPPDKWPVYLDARNIAEIFGCSTRSAQRKIKKGLFGPFIEMDGKRFVHRSRLLTALKKLEQAVRLPIQKPR